MNILPHNKRDKILVLVILLVVISYFGLRSSFKGLEQNVEAIGETEPLTLDWLSYDEGLALAEKENKYVLIDFYTDWCGYCQKMERETYSKEEVKRILSENFVTVKVNAESNNKVREKGEEITERELARRYNVSGYPTIWFLESNQQRIALLPGFVPAEQFILVIKYIGEGWYKNISFEEYFKKNTS